MASSNERNHRLLYKAKPMESSQNRRRAQELERQRTARRTFTDLARNLIAKQATDADDMVSSSQEVPPLPPSALMPPHCIEAGGSTIDAAAHMSTSASAPISTVVVDDGEAMITSSTTPTTTLLRKPSFYANLLMLPESLQEVPEDLASQWLMVVVPRGERCLVIASHGTTISRAQSGAKLERFASALPGGAFDAGGVHSSGDCILDCVYHEPSATYYVLDLLAWRGHLYYDCSTEFRFYWRNTKLAETRAAIGGVPANQHAILPLDVHACTPEGFHAAAQIHQYQADTCYLLLYNKEAQYEPGETTPLVASVELAQFDQLHAIATAAQLHDPM